MIRYCLVCLSMLIFCSTLLFSLLSVLFNVLLLISLLGFVVCGALLLFRILVECASIFVIEHSFLSINVISKKRCVAFLSLYQVLYQAINKTRNEGIFKNLGNYERTLMNTPHT